jgi:hypothetical protein
MQKEGTAWDGIACGKDDLGKQHIVAFSSHDAFGAYLSRCFVLIDYSIE